MKASCWPRLKEWFRFVIGGATNTVVSYGVYLMLRVVIDYQVAYFIAYALGVLLSYILNALIVFKVPVSLRGLISFPVVYLVQYFGSAVMLGGLVEGGKVSELIAPLVVAAMMLPITYVLSKILLVRKTH